MKQHVRLGNLEIRRDSAKERQLEYNKLTIADRIAKLDKKLGKGLGAIRERAKLQKKSEAPKPEPKPEPKKVVNATKSPKEKFVKKYKTEK